MGVEDVPMFGDDGSVLLPYAGTSGWSGSSTSKERAVRADRDGTTSERQRTVLVHLSRCGYEGVTWKELGLEMGWHHGVSSGVLSVLHKEGAIERLASSRDRCKVYVLPEFVLGRDVEDHGRKPKPCSNCGWVES